MVSIVLLTKSLPLPSSRPRPNRNRIYGPSHYSKTILFFSSLFTLIYFIEPSLVYRILLNFKLDETIDSMCVVPPWWWVERNESIVYIIKAHGWASWIDLVQWVGGVGIFGFFVFMKTEYTRNMEVTLFLL